MVLFSLVLMLAQAAAQDDKAAEKAAAEAVAVFEKAFKGSEADRISAIEELGMVHHLKTANRLAVVLGGMQSGQVRTAAVKTLGKFTEHKKLAAAVLSNALPAHTKEPGLFAAICVCLAELKEPFAVATLARYFEDKDEALARMSMGAAGQLGSSAAIDPLIAVVGRAERVIRAAANAASRIVTDSDGNQFVSPPEVRARDRARVLLEAANRALTAITQEPITTSDNWSAWWSRNKRTFGRK